MRLFYGFTLCGAQARKYAYGDHSLYGTLDAQATQARITDEKLRQEQEERKLVTQELARLQARLDAMEKDRRG